MMQGSHQKEKEALIAREGMEESRRSHPNMMSHPVMLRAHFRSLSLTSLMFPFILFFGEFAHVFNPRYGKENLTFCPGPVGHMVQP